MMNMNKERKVVESVSYTPQTLTGVLPSGRKLTIEVDGKEGKLLEVTAPNGKVLEYTVLVTVREKDVPPKKAASKE